MFFSSPQHLQNLSHFPEPPKFIFSLKKNEEHKVFLFEQKNIKYPWLIISYLSNQTKPVAP